MVKRIIKPSKSQSFFVFGARGTGKSTFIRDQFLQGQSVWTQDFLDPNLEEEYSKNPISLYQKIQIMKQKPDWIFIDEVQKVPKILDVVHKSIEELKVKFILTGSSARKLKRGGANLLAGRALLNSIYPLTESELGIGFQLESALRWGTLPGLLNIEEEATKKQFLRSYSQVYLKEEIKVEQLVRNIDPFRNFLEIAAQMSGRIVNYSKIAHDIGVDYKTVQQYFDILSDTWIGFILPAFHQSVRKSQKQSPKFYFFDLGVKNSLCQLLDSTPVPGNVLYGELFEHYIVNEIYRYNDYYFKDYRLSYLRTKNDLEVDLILTKGRNNYLIEIKSDDKVDLVALKKLKNLADDIPHVKDIFLVSRQNESSLVEGVKCLRWREFLRLFQSSEF